jgi:tetrahydromethanopterin S-methyltransferase subunit G
MENKVLELLIDMQREIKEINNKIDKIEYRVADGFETLEILNNNTSQELNAVKVRLAKVENRVKEINKVN